MCVCVCVCVSPLLQVSERSIVSLQAAANLLFNYVCVCTHVRVGMNNYH